MLKILVTGMNTGRNEIGSVLVVLRNAQLGTYLGWNIIPGGDRRMSLDERYSARARHPLDASGRIALFGLVSTFAVNGKCNRSETKFGF